MDIKPPGFCLSLLTARNLSGALALALPLCLVFPGHNVRGCLCLSGAEVLEDLEAPGFIQQGAGGSGGGERERVLAGKSLAFFPGSIGAESWVWQRF